MIKHHTPGMKPNDFLFIEVPLLPLITANLKAPKNISKLCIRI